MRTHHKLRGVFSFVLCLFAFRIAAGPSAERPATHTPDAIRVAAPQHTRAAPHTANASAWLGMPPIPALPEFAVVMYLSSAERRPQVSRWVHPFRSRAPPRTA